MISGGADNDEPEDEDDAGGRGVVAARKKKKKNAQHSGVVRLGRSKFELQNGEFVSGDLARPRVGDMRVRFKVRSGEPTLFGVRYAVCYVLCAMCRPFRECAQRSR